MRTLKRKIKGLLMFPICWSLGFIFNNFLGYKFSIENNPIDELKYILRD